MKPKQARGVKVVDFQRALDVSEALSILAIQKLSCQHDAAVFQAEADKDAREKKDALARACRTVARRASAGQGILESAIVSLAFELVYLGHDMEGEVEIRPAPGVEVGACA